MTDAETKRQLVDRLAAAARAAWEFGEVALAMDLEGLAYEHCGVDLAATRRRQLAHLVDQAAARLK